MWQSKQTLQKETEVFSRKGYEPSSFCVLDFKYFMNIYEVDGVFVRGR